MDGLLSQEEINALFSSSEEEPDAGASTSNPSADDSIDLTPEEKDTIGEISNISMGTSATALSTLVSQKVDISTPRVEVINWQQLEAGFDRPCIFIQISYKEGLDGNNILILKEKDVKIISDLMMGGDGSNTSGELTELHLSAISEAMNQMMGSASTSISSMLETKVDISPPNASIVDLNSVQDGSTIAEFLKGRFVKVAFKMEIGNLVDSELMQLYPVEFAKSMYDKFVGGNVDFGTGTQLSGHPEAKKTPPPKPAPSPAAAQMQQAGVPNMGQMPQMGAMPQGQMMQPVQEVNVSTAQFQPFMQMQSPLLQQENIDLLLDVPLEVTVELGRTSKSIKEILDFAPGTVVELNRLAGEPIDVLVNGKYVAKGEVVVIAEAFGIRITDVIK